MCGSIKLEGQKDFTRIRQYIPADFLVNNTLQMKGYTWDGFARADGSADKVKTMVEQWPSDIWVPEILKVEAFTERNRSNNQTVVFPAKRIIVIVSEAGKMKLLTRPAKTADEIAVHNRMPLRIPAIMTREQFIYDFNRLTSGNYH